MRRREFIGLVGGAAAWPLAARAQQGPLPVVGLLYQMSLDVGTFIAAFRQGLRDAGYVEGRNIVIVDRYASRAEQLPQLAAELATLPVDVIFAGGSEAVRAAQQATQTIPIVITSSDPIGAGLVASLARPGKNTTGVSHQTTDLSAKGLQLLWDIGGHIAVVVALWNPNDPPAALSLKEVETGGSTMGIKVEPLEVRGRDEFEKAFASAAKMRPDGLFVIGSPLTVNNAARIAEFALANKLPSAAPYREFAHAGGLMSYGVNLSDQYRKAAAYVDRILKGAKPAELPVQQPTKFEFVLNLKTAKALGLTIPSSLLAIADEVIE